MLPHVSKKRRAAFGWILRVGSGCAAAIVLVALISPAIARATEDDRAATERMVTELDHDSAHATLTADAVAHARKALERALRMRQSGDDARARETEGLARRWVELGRDLARTADAEAQAGLLRSAATDAGAHVERERALLEETIARTGRLKAEIEAAEHEENSAPSRTSGMAKNSDAATRDGGAPKTKTTTMKTTPHGDGGTK
jgi:chromosome segregation ATPase